ncbi:MAG TPA: hypothetical protein VE756_12095 [Burkholderiales bacterium]|nr:hypothetical protein [Burkholderiales bacterium]
MKRLALLAALLCLPVAFAAQTAGGGGGAADALARGIRAYDDLDFEQAAGLLRRALTAQGVGTLSRDDASRALIYLSAIELLRDRKDSARAIARRLVVTNPRFRPDELLFPPQLLLLYEVVRRATPAVISDAPADTAIRPGSETLGLRLYASAVHNIDATLVALDGRVMRTLFRGPIGDSLALPWNGLDSANAPLVPGTYAITVKSLDRAGNVVRILRLPLSVLPARVDTLIHPTPPRDTVLLPERRPLGPALRVLAPGLLGGVGLAVLPGAIASGERPSGARFAIGGALTIAGVVAFLSRKPGHALPENAAHNDVVRAWRREDAAVARRNAERAQGVIGVHIGQPIILTPSGP